MLDRVLRKATAWSRWSRSLWKTSSKPSVCLKVSNRSSSNRSYANLKSCLRANISQLIARAHPNQVTTFLEGLQASASASRSLVNCRCRMSRAGWERACFLCQLDLSKSSLKTWSLSWISKRTRLRLLWSTTKSKTKSKSTSTTIRFKSA